MNTPRLFSSKLLAQVIKLIDHLTDEEAAAIADGSAWLSLTIEQKAHTPPRTITAKGPKTNARKPQVNLEDVVQGIRGSQSRDEVRTILSNAGKLSKDDLKSILAALGEPTKEATAQKLIDRIVEAVAGVRSDQKSILGRHFS